MRRLSRNMADGMFVKKYYILDSRIGLSTIQLSSFSLAEDALQRPRRRPS
ncbi:hypothetical protein [Prevotella histicola]